MQGPAKRPVGHFQSEGRMLMLLVRVLCYLHLRDINDADQAKYSTHVVRRTGKSSGKGITKVLSGSALLDRPRSMFNSLGLGICALFVSPLLVPVRIVDVTDHDALS
jgi:hypothetical protein